MSLRDQNDSLCGENDISFKIYPHKYFNNTEIQKLKAQVEKVFTAKEHSVKYLIHSRSHLMEIIITIKLV